MTINPVAKWTLALAFVLAVGAWLIWLVNRWRDVDAQDSPEASDMLTKFRELHTRGGLSDVEYRTIKSKLAGQLQDDVGMSPDELAACDQETGNRASDEDDAGQDSS